MSKNQKNILVTGGAGYIGGHVVKQLAAEGFSPFVYDLARNPYVEKFGPLIQGDVRDTASVIKAMRDHDCAAVMHFAASISVPESVVSPQIYYDNNIVGTLSVLNAMREAGVPHIVFSSTAAVYGVPEHPLIDEDAALDPINPYGRTKLYCENMIADMGRAYGIERIIFRYFNAVGCDPEGKVGFMKAEPSNLVPLVLLTALGKRTHVDILGTDYATLDGTAIRDYVHVSDLARAHVMALRALQKDGQSHTLNLGSGAGYSVREVIEMAEAVTGRSIPTLNAPRRAGDPEKTIAVSDKAYDVLGWRAQHSMEDMIKTAWDWYIKIQS